MADLMETIEKLKDICKNPRAQMDRYIAHGKKVVGCFEPFTPEELVHACGMVPMGLWGGKTEPKLAKSYLPPFACPVMQANMEFGLNGTYKGMSAVIIPAICDTLRCMTQNWRFGVPSIPMAPIVYPQNRTSPAALDYLISEYEQVLVVLATATGEMMKERCLRETIEIYNEHNAVMREFAAAAADHLDIITPTVRHAVMKSAMFCEKSEHTRLVRAVIDGLKELPVHEFTGTKVVLTGILCEPDELLQALEDNHMAVAADDLVQESVQYQTDIPLTGGGGLKRLAMQWMDRSGCSLIHEDGKPRGAHLVELCKKTGAQGVITCLMKFCDPEEYDQPYFERDVKAAGLSCLSLEIDPLNVSSAQIVTRIQAFAETF